MPMILIVGLVLVVLLGMAMWATFGLIGLALTLFMSGLLGWAADAVVPGQLPGGFIGAIVAGIIGGFLGKLVLGNLGPELFGVRIIPAFVGAVIVVGAAEIFANTRSRRALR